MENYAYLPTTVIELLNDTIPVVAQWNFHILCHPLSRDLPLNRLRAVDDLKTRMAMGAVTMDDLMSTRAARFQLAPVDADVWRDGKYNYDLLDELMGEIPGLDNYQGYINDSSLGEVAYPYGSSRANGDGPLNVAYFHRFYKVKKAGAMGTNTRMKGFSDRYLFMAQNTQAKVAGLTMEVCKRRNMDCTSSEKKWSYAIPLEIIYTTPLSSWNPYGLIHGGDARTERGKAIYDGPDGKRNGRSHPDKAYNGTNSKVYYRTPEHFFDGEINTDPADTTKATTNILDPEGNVRQVRASGHRIFLPDIPGVGVLRQRYPIMPVHGEGSAVWKELEALKDIILQPIKYQHMFRESLQFTKSSSTTSDGNDSQNDSNLVEFTTSASSANTGSHVHPFTLTATQYRSVLDGDTVRGIITEKASGHSHELTLKKNNRRYVIKACDDSPRCSDGHGRIVRLV